MELQIDTYYSTIIKLQNIYGITDIYNVLRGTKWFGITLTIDLLAIWYCLFASFSLH